MQAFFNFLAQIWSEVKPWYTINPWEAGLRIRWGRYVKVLVPGVHFQLPFLDSCHSLNVVPRVVNLPHQSLKTLDGKNIALSAALAYAISDVEKVYLEVDDHDESHINLALGHLADFVCSHPAASCSHDNIQTVVGDSLREAVEPWGIELISLYLTDLTDVKTFRLMHDQNPPKVPTLTIG